MFNQENEADITTLDDVKQYVAERSYKITAGEHTFKDEDIAQAVKFAKYLNYTLKIENVHTAGGTHPDYISFGTLRDIGLLSKSYIPGSGAPDDCDPHGIEWFVCGDV